MKDLTTAIYSRYVNDTDTPIANLRDGDVTDMWPEEGDESAVFPFLVIAHITTAGFATMGATSGSDFDEPVIRFSAFDNVSYPDRAEGIGQLVVKAYRDYLLTISGKSVIRADKVGERQTRDADNKGWQYIVEIRYMIQEQRT